MGKVQFKWILLPPLFQERLAIARRRKYFVEGGLFPKILQQWII